MPQKHKIKKKNQNSVHFPIKIKKLSIFVYVLDNYFYFK